MAGQLKKATLSAGIAQINVGPNETPFDVHIELICDCSPYFDNLYKNRADPNSTVTKDPISFPNVNPDIFAEFVSWMYKDTLSPDFDFLESGNSTGPNDLSKIIFLLQLWELAGQFSVDALQAAAIAQCEKNITKQKPDDACILSAATVNYVYEHTEPGSVARRLALDIWLNRSRRKMFSKHKREFPVEFVLDFCERLLRWASGDDEVSRADDGAGGAGGGALSAPGAQPRLLEAPQDAIAGPEGRPLLLLPPQPGPQPQSAEETHVYERLATPEQVLRRETISPSSSLRGAGGEGQGGSLVASGSSPSPSATKGSQSESGSEADDEDDDVLATPSPRDTFKLRNIHSS